MTGRASRQKGAAAEREVVDILADRGYDVHRTPHSGALEWMKGDVTGTPWHLEVKRQEALRVVEWHEKAELDADGRPAILIFRRNREPWRVCMRLEDFLDLMECANCPPGRDDGMG